MEKNHSNNIVRALAFIFILIILGFVIFSLFWQAEPLEDVKVIKEMEYSLTQISKVSLDIRSADINIIVSNVPNLKIEQYSNLGKKKQKEFMLENENGVITIKDDNDFSFSIFKPWTWDKEVYYNLYIPAHYQKDLSVDIEEGDVTFTSNNDSSKLRNIDLHLITGDFINEGYLNLQEFRIDGITGDVRLGEIDANTVDIKTITGDIKADRMKAVANIQLTTGDISLKKVLFMGNSKMSTVTGDISIDLVEGNNCTFESKTTVGDIRIDNNRVGEGTNQVTLKTTTGDIKVND